MARSIYTAPEIEDYGRLTALTASHTTLVAANVLQVSASLVASVVGGGNPPPGGETPTNPPFQPEVAQPVGDGGVPSGPEPDVPGSGPTSPDSGSGSPGPGGGQGSGGAGGGANEVTPVGGGGGAGGGELPFTGFAVAVVAGLGLLLTSAGARARQVARRAGRRSR